MVDMPVDPKWSQDETTVYRQWTEDVAANNPAGYENALRMYKRGLLTADDFITDISNLWLAAQARSQ